MGFDRGKSIRYPPLGEDRDMPPPSLRIPFCYREIFAAQSLPPHRCQQCAPPAWPGPVSEEILDSARQNCHQTQKNSFLELNSAFPSHENSESELLGHESQGCIGARAGTSGFVVNDCRYSADAQHRSTESRFADATCAVSQLRDL